MTLIVIMAIYLRDLITGKKFSSPAAPPPSKQSVERAGRDYSL